MKHWTEVFSTTMTARHVASAFSPHDIRRTFIGVILATYRSGKAMADANGFPPLWHGASALKGGSREKRVPWRRLQNWLSKQLSPVRIAALVLLVLGVLVLGLYEQDNRWYLGLLIQRLYNNAGTDMLSIAVTVLIIDHLYAIRQRQDARLELKAQLIRHMGSRVCNVTLQAVEDLAHYGWLYDGSLRDAYLEKANLQGATLWSANLQGADLVGANLQGATLWSANLQGADLVGANLQRADLVGANLQGADLEGANLQGATLWSANLQGADLEGAKLAEVRHNKWTTWPEGFDPEAAGAVNTDNRRE